MEYVLIDGVDVGGSRVGFGCAAIGGHDYGPVDDATSVRAINVAIDSGINFFDTADVYGLGRSEELLGRTLTTRRAEVVIATKGGVAWNESGVIRRTLAPWHIRQAIDNSLRRLRVDYIDLYQLHWPDPEVSIADAVGEVERARQAGKVRAIGVCNFSHKMVIEARASAAITTLQAPISLLERQWSETISACAADLGVGALCYNVLAQGMLSGKYDASSRFVGTDLRARSELFSGERLRSGLVIVERLRSVAKRLGATPGQVATRWVLDQPGVRVALTGIKNETQARENSAATAVVLSPEDKHFLQEG